ncbi:MAG: FAD-binding protein [Bdellovibrionaceae bacterium]|nr:FAD-binding protein [Bdellovibrionales bacterium]MCB9254646.1 FAD-binding protein [Pseudobdellovibrionaceae bacterium]
METFDVLVLGSGAAGFAAAVTAKEQGASVAVLSRGAGASAVSSGAFDFGRPAAQGSPTDFASRTQHNTWKSTYSRLLADPGNPPSPVDAQRVFMGIERALGLPLKMSWEKALLLPVSNGHWKQVHVAQAAQAGIDLEAIQGKKVAFVYHASWRLTARPLCRQWEQTAEMNFGKKVEIEAVDLSALSPMPDAPLPVVAVRLQRDTEFRTRFFQMVAEIGKGVDAVLLPPIFLDPKFLESLQKEVQKPVSECLGTVEAVPGKRLQDSIFSALDRAQIPLFRADHIRAEITDDLVSGVDYWNQGDSGPRKLRAGKYVLASGKFFGGGVDLQYEKLSEPLFGLPLYWSRQESFAERRAELPWSDRGFFESQTWSQLGVWVDERWQPVGPDNRAVLNNVFACGSVIGGLDFARERVGLGYMIYSGGQCGLVAAKT